MTAQQSVALKHWARIIKRWPLDKIRPESVSFQANMQRRIDRITNPSLNAAATSIKGNEALVTAAPPAEFSEAKESKQVNALYTLLENRRSPKQNQVRFIYPETEGSIAFELAVQQETEPGVVHARIRTWITYTFLRRPGLVRCTSKSKATGWLSETARGPPPRSPTPLNLYTARQALPEVATFPKLQDMDCIVHKPSVYVLDPYHEDAITVLRNDSSVHVVLPPEATKDKALANASGLLIRSDSQITADDIRNAHPRLKYIVKQGVGVDNVDLKAAKAKNVEVYNTPGLNSEAVAELTLALALCIARRVNEFDRAIRQGEKVVRSQMLGKSLFGTTLGVIGMGAIGLEVAKKWKAAMGGRVVAYDPRAKDAWLEEFGHDGFTKVHGLPSLLEVADVITIHTPLNSSTANMLSKSEFASMKYGAILLNCARGGIVDEVALLDALQSGKLYGAGLDAVVHEPPTHAQYGETLLSHPRVVITPHVGASTEDSQRNSGRRAVEIMLDLLAGRGHHRSVA